jgi:hypothetical protein
MEQISVHSPNKMLEKLKLVTNIVLLILQVVVTAAYYGMLESRPSLQEISRSLYPDSKLLMDSALAEILVTYPAFFVVLAISIVSFVKEVRLKDRMNKMLINAAVLFVISSLFGIASYKLYTPIYLAG